MEGVRWQGGGYEGSLEGRAAERWRSGWRWRWRGSKRDAAKWSTAKEGERRTVEGHAIEEGERRAAKGSHRGTTEKVEERWRGIRQRRARGGWAVVAEACDGGSRWF